VSDALAPNAQAPNPQAPTLPPPGPSTTARRPPRWGVQTGFIQLRMPAFWLFVVMAGIGLLYFALVQLLAVIISPAGWLLSWGLLILYVIPVVLVLRWIDLYEHEPRSMLIAAFLWGALVATFFAGLGNDFWGVVIARIGGGEFASQWSAALTAPPIEEVYKYLGLVVLYLVARLEFDDLIDGFIYGALIGLGFAVSEDVFYFMFQFGGDVPAVIEGFYVRVIASGLYGHVTFTGIAGIGFAYFVTHRYDASLAKRLVVAVGLLLLAMAAHFVWNSPLFDDLPILLYGIVKGLPFFIGLIVLLYLARRRENQDLAEILAGEVGKPGLLPREMEALRDRRARRAATKRVRQEAGPEAERIFKQLQREQIKLALTVSAVDSVDDVRLLHQRAVIVGLRGQLWAIPGAAAALQFTPDEIAANQAATSAAGFAPSRTVGISGGWAWPTPNQTTTPGLPLAPGLQLQVVEDRGGWLLVRAANGWLGWTGAPYLTGTPTA
jgi:RsiW-degrading membrane proteinase PrsW (M82 family)